MERESRQAARVVSSAAIHTADAGPSGVYYYTFGGTGVRISEVHIVRRAAWLPLSATIELPSTD